MNRGSSPHTRGAPGTTVWGDPEERIIPAYAGSTVTTCGRTRSRGDHPRIRGEHGPGRRRRRLAWGSSPHTRGALRVGQGVGDALRIIPAYAGSTGLPAGVDHALGDHPRIRGEHRPARCLTRCRPGSSPHTRGALCLSISSRSSPRIIPAYAGSTGSGRRRRPSCADHPRIRGEHVQEGFARCREGGSSPHTRGARQSVASVTPHRGIIPAYAGSTRWPGSRRR